MACWLKRKTLSIQTLLSIYELDNSCRSIHDMEFAEKPVINNECLTSINLTEKNKFLSVRRVNLSERNQFFILEKWINLILCAKKNRYYLVRWIMQRFTSSNEKLRQSRETKRTE